MINPLQFIYIYISSIQIFLHFRYSIFIISFQKREKWINGKIEIDSPLSLATEKYIARTRGGYAESIFLFLFSFLFRKKKIGNSNEPVSKKTNSRVTMGTWPETAFRNSPGGK